MRAALAAAIVASLCGSHAAGSGRDVPGAAWGGPFEAVATAWTRRLDAATPIDVRSAAWVRAVFFPPGIAEDRSGARYAGRLQFCTREAYLQTHLVDGRATVGTRGCAAGDSGATLVFAHPSDPAYAIACFEYGPHCAGENATVRIPRHANANANSDHHLAVIDEATDRECDFWETGWFAPDRSTGVVGSNAMLAIGNGGCGSLRGDGTGTSWQATGANVPLSAGLLRAADVLGPSGDGSDGRIPHALYVTLPCASHDFRYPASRSDGATQGCPPEGARLFLRPSGYAKFERVRPALPAWELTIVRAYRDYGLIVSDHGGDIFGLLLEDDAGALAYGARAPWSQTFIDFARRDPATARARIGLTVANDVYHVNLAVPTDLDVADWAFAAECVNRGTCA